MSYNEIRHSEFTDFPLEYHYVDKNHHRYNMSSHWHNEFEIIRISEGELHINLNNSNDYICKKNDVIFVNPETIHRAMPIDCIYECVIFNPEFFSSTPLFKNFIDAIINHDYFIHEFSKGKECMFSDALSMVFASLKDDCDKMKFSAIGAMYMLLGTIASNKLYTEKGIKTGFIKDKNLPRLKKVLTYIRSNYDKQISLGDMAEVAELSVKRFCYFFKSMTEKTPVEYLNEYRIEISARKLMNSDMSITDVAYSCGFNDLSYFIKTFKRIKAVTPRTFRKGK